MASFPPRVNEKEIGNMMKVLRGHQNWVYSCAFSPDSSMLCSVGASKTVVAAILV
uniref:WD repeat and SOCS box containing 1 n=1 Tax=Prolemur simus TaxID=1328070 RepID=A0A8C9DN05_PROSS